MEISVRHDPAFAVARATLAPNEAIRAESGAMLATSGDVTFEAKMHGGLMGSLKRAALGGESFFMTTFTAGPAAAGSTSRRTCPATSSCTPSRARPG